MVKKQDSKSGIVRLSVSVTKEEEAFIEENQLSPTKLLKRALEQKGFKTQTEKH